MNIPPELLEQLRKGNVVLFCGAGISMSEGGLPSGGQLAQELAQRAMLGDVGGMTLPEVAQAYELEMGHQSLIAYITSRIDDPRYVPLCTHHLIATLPLKQIITTNWDNLLEGALRQAGWPFVKVVRDSGIAYADEEKALLIKLHGSIEQKDTIVITGDNYYDVFARLPETANLVRSYFATRTVLFLGFGLADQDFKRLYHEVVRHLGEHKRRAYAVQLDPAPLTVKYWQQKNVQVIAADATAFLEALREELSIAEPSPPPGLEQHPFHPRPAASTQDAYHDLALPTSVSQIIADRLKAGGHPVLLIGDIVVNIHYPLRSLIIDDPALASQYLGALNQPVLFPARATEQADIPSILPSLPNPALWVEGDFAGRERIIQQLMAAVDTTRMIVILGIPGVGKTALLAQIASRLEPSQVFGYRFRPGLTSLDNVLISLARFLDNQPGCEGILVDVIQALRFSGHAPIDLIIEGLNAGCYYLFFDSIRHITGHPALNSFFTLLKEQLRQGTVFVAGRSKPDFYTPLDENKQLVMSVELEGLHESEIIEFFDCKDISLAPEVAKALDTRFGALPLALELMTPLAAGTFTEPELLSIADQAKEQAIDYLFAEVYEQLDPSERDLLTTASLLVFPFSRGRLLDAHRAVFGQDGGQANFLKLRNQLLIQKFATNLYQVHEIIGALALKHANLLSQRQSQLADYLVAQAPDEFENQLEAILLYYRAEAYDRAAELVVPIVDLYLLEHDPDLAETFLSAFREEMVSARQWVWLVGSQGVVGSSRRQYDKAEHCYRTMLQLAEELEDKAATAMAFQRLGIVYLSRDDKIAERYYHSSLSLKKELDDLEGQAQIYNNLGVLYIDRGQLTDARSVLQEGLSLLERVRAPEWQKLSLYANLGYLHAKQGQWQEANRLTENARRIAEEIGSPCDVAKSTYNLGIHEAWQGNQEAARERYLEALGTAEVHGCWEIEELAQMALGRQNHELGNYDEAIACFQRVAEIRQRIGDISGLASITFDIGTFYWHKGDLQKAVDHYEKGIARFEHLAHEEQVRLYLTNIYGLATQSAEPRRLLQSLKHLKNRLLAGPPSYMLAEIYGMLGHFYLWLLHQERVALACMRQEIALLTQLDRDRELAEALASLAAVYEDLGHYGDALDVATQAIELAESQRLLHQAGVAYYNRANCFATLEVWPQAENDYSRSLAIAEEIKDTQLRELVRHNLGEMYRRQGQLEEAVKLLRSSLVSVRERGDIDGEIRTLNNLGLAYCTLRQDQKALACFHDALELCRQHDLKHDESNILISLGNFYLESGLPAKAKGYYEQALAAARAAEDIYMEEGSVLSLAYAHRQLGTFEEIADDFKAVAERAGALEHYENLLQFLTFAGEMNFEEGETGVAAEMFEQALLLATWIGYDRLQKLKSHSEIHTHLLQLFDVIARICALIDKALHDDVVERAQAFYDSLIGNLQHSDFWGKHGLWIVNLLGPLGDYLAKRPEQSAWEFFISATVEESDLGTDMK